MENIFFSIFSRLGTFSYLLRKVMEWLILELHEMITITRVVVFPLEFNLLYDWGQQRGVLRFVKNDQFLMFLAA